MYAIITCCYNIIIIITQFLMELYLKHYCTISGALRTGSGRNGQWCRNILDVDISTCEQCILELEISTHLGQSKIAVMHTKRCHVHVCGFPNKHTTETYPHRNSSQVLFPSNGGGHCILVEPLPSAAASAVPPPQCCRICRKNKNWCSYTQWFRLKVHLKV